MSLSEVLTVLLPDSSELCIDAFELNASAPEIILTLTSTQMAASCPLCHQAATRHHSHYSRMLADLPWAQIPVRLHLQVRKLFCDTVDCPRRIFTERLASVVAPWARRTIRLAEQQRHIGLTAGGSAGARLGAHLDRPASRNTLLHLVRTTPQQDQPTPRVLGIDDWSQRKGHSHGTILVDIERHRQIELLPDREAATVATWLAAHPGVEIICRDRAGAYAEGARTGAPSAIQVADRFHLLRNLHDALRRALEQHTSSLASLSNDQTPGVLRDESAIASTVHTAPPAELLHIVPPEAPSARTLEQASQRRAQRLARYEQVRQLHNEGWTLSAIAQQIGLDRTTVRKYAIAPSFPERQPLQPRRSVLDPYKPYLLQRWNEGCRTGTVLWHELEQKGYRGKRVTVFRYVSRLRTAHGLPPKKRTLATHGQVVEQRRLSTTPRSLAWFVLCRSEKLDETEQQLLVQLRELHPELDEAVMLSQEFARLVRERGASELDAWLERATTSSLASFRGFAMGVRRDYSAVAAALSEEWSSGQVEGQVNRLKVIKRSMFGRAKLDLLEQRVLYAA